jgi:hypothetical protein
MDPNIAYDRNWTVLKNPGTKNAYKGTIHISAEIGSEASFRFTGERFRLGYKRGKSFGIVTVIIDDQPYRFHEQAFDLLWRSPQLSPGEHFVRIIHESGESINLDYIEILDESQAASAGTNYSLITASSVRPGGPLRVSGVDPCRSVAFTGHNPTSYLRLRYQMHSATPQHASSLHLLPTG